MDDMEYEVAQPKPWLSKTDADASCGGQKNFAVIHDVVRPRAPMHITSQRKPLLAEPVSSVPATTMWPIAYLMNRYFRHSPLKTSGSFVSISQFDFFCALPIRF